MSLITSIEHAYAIAIGDLKKVGIFVGHTILPVLKAIHAEAPVIEAVTETVSPALANIERTGDALLGAIIKALDDGTAAATAGGVNVTLDAQLVADIKAIIPQVKAAAAPNVAALARQ